MDPYLDVDDLPADPGVYVFVRHQVVEELMKVIYIGHTGDADTRFDKEHHKWECIEDEGYTHIYFRPAPSKEAAKRIESDLLGFYDPPCNDTDS